MITDSNEVTDDEEAAVTVVTHFSDRLFIS
jgi:hypothetical protein